MEARSREPGPPTSPLPPASAHLEHWTIPTALKCLNIQSGDPPIASWILSTSCEMGGQTDYISTVGKVRPRLLKGGLPELGSSSLGQGASFVSGSSSPNEWGRGCHPPRAALHPHMPAQPAGLLAPSLIPPPLGFSGKSLGQSQA